MMEQLKVLYLNKIKNIKSNILCSHQQINIHYDTGDYVLISIIMSGAFNIVSRAGQPIMLTAIN